MHPAYPLTDADDQYTPALVFHPELIAANIRAVAAAAGGPDRLRPHVKTHKTAEIVRMQLDAGVAKHKCATIAEAEMLANVGTPDVLIAYPLVGPNVRRLVQLIGTFPGTEFSTIVDHPDQLGPLAAAVAAAGFHIDVLIDLNVGMNRTGIPIGPAADELYELLAVTPGVRPGGLHGYDGHNNAESRQDRDAVARATVEKLLAMRGRMEAKGLAVPRLICGGTPGFPSYAAMQDVPDLECSPGTYVLHDVGYGSRYPDILGVVPAAVFLTRVVSKPTPNRVTFDLGNKAVAADPPLAKRVQLLDAPEYTIVTHSEEHLVIETAAPERYRIGQVVYAIPSHICPSVALHRDVLIAKDHHIVGRWPVTARDRRLSI